MVVSYIYAILLYFRKNKRLLLDYRHLSQNSHDNFNLVKAWNVEFLLWLSSLKTRGGLCEVVDLIPGLDLWVKNLRSQMWLRSGVARAVG